MRTRALTFPGAHGDRLSARIGLLPDGHVEAHALFAHCFTCSKDLKAAVNITRALARAGIAVLRFDFTGLGESEGEFADTTFTSNAEDLVAAADYMGRELEAPAIVVGHSLGGAAVLQAARRIESCRAAATIGAPFDPGHIRHLFAGALDEIEAEGEAEVVLAGRSFTLSRGFVRDLEAQHMASIIGELRRPLLIFHSPVDRMVGVENAGRIYEAARHPRASSRWTTPTTSLLDEADSLYVGSMLATWAGRYIGVHGAGAE